MKTIEAIGTLKAYQRWRRGARIPMPDPKTIGVAIDVVIKFCQKQIKTK